MSVSQPTEAPPISDHAPAAHYLPSQRSNFDLAAAFSAQQQYTPRIASARVEPPAKRRRVDEDGVSSSQPAPRTRGMKDCLRAQVLPHVRNRIGKLPFPNHPATHDIAVKAVTAIAKSKWFKSRFEKTNGFLTAQDEVQIQEKADRIVEDLVRRSNRVPVPQPPSNALDPTPAQDATAPSTTAAPQSANPTELPCQETISESASTSLPVHKPPTTSAKPPPQSRPTLRVSWPKVNLKQGQGVQKLPVVASSPSIPAQKPLPSKPTPLVPQTSNPPRFNSSSWFQLKKRPYLIAADRDSIARGVRLFSGSVGLSGPTVYHVDFTADEIAQIASSLATYIGGSLARLAEPRVLAHLCHEYNIPSLVQVPGRDTEDVRNFCSDLLAGKTSSPENLRLLSLTQVDRQQEIPRTRSRIPSLLFARELEGNTGFGRMRQLENFENEFKKAREDELALVAEFTNCAGDIATVSWVSNDNFICGTTAHSDTHNQQYNKPGNLLMCSAAQGTLRAFADHRIPRPWVERGENSTEAMRQSQDPWLYSSVVSSDYDDVDNRAYTSSFDKTVKVWEVADKLMTALGTWQHDGNVNFVVAAKDGSGRVATASDVPSEAVRIYTVNESSIAESSYQSFSCSRLDANDGSGSGKWAYYPATMHWGRASWAQHLLVVGYSPRSFSGEDHDIPEDKRKSGEITMWDAQKGCRIPMLTATTANVFEVAWHPTRQQFALATTPSTHEATRARTQIHMFQRDLDRDDGGYTEFQDLDCPASDINEVTIMPNSLTHSYVTAACTDGKVYIWDTAQGDKPIHELKHGYPLDEFSGDREKEDTGVKFTAWGTSLDRFYTGGSDGVVKVWNVRKKRRPFERNLLHAPGPISSGAFSPNKSRLSIGDATGRVFLFSLDKQDELDTHFVTLPGSIRKVRRPRPVIPHPEPPPPEKGLDSMEHDATEPPAGVYARRTYLESQQLVLTNNPVIGAVQGPFYASTGLYRREAHLDDDPSEPLLSQYDRLQRSSAEASRGMRRRSMRRLKVPFFKGSHIATHRSNLELERSNASRNLDVNTLNDEVMRDLVRAGAALYLGSDAEEYNFIYDASHDEP